MKSVALTKSMDLMFTEILHNHVKSAQKYFLWKYKNYRCPKSFLKYPMMGCSKYFHVSANKNITSGVYNNGIPAYITPVYRFGRPNYVPKLLKSV